MAVMKARGTRHGRSPGRARVGRWRQLATAAATLSLAAVACSSEAASDQDPDIEPDDPDSSATPALPSPDSPADRVLEGDETFPDGFTVPAGEVWELDPDDTTTVTTEANVVVEGVLRMRPEDDDVEHTLRFTGIDERRIVGADPDADHTDHDDGSGHVVATDVGLWVVDQGQLDLRGSERTGWNRTGDDPTWQEGDEILAAPIEPGDSTGFTEHTPGDPVPAVEHAGETYATETFNLTRNVRIQGEGDGTADPDSNGRAHVHISSSRPQAVRWVELRHMGPRRVGDDDPTDGFLSRYPLHFHRTGDGSRGSVVEGVVVRDSGNRAFVPHGADGIHFEDTIAYNVFESAYWWDPDDTGHGGPATNATDDVTFERALAASIHDDPPERGYLVAGFVLGEGENVAVRDSAAVGVQGNNTASGYHWPATANGNEHNVWDFSGNVAHNNRVNGIFVWQNDGNPHRVEDFVGFHNGAFGVDHGAYANNYTYEDLTLFGNGEAGIRSKAASTDESQRWTDIDTDGLLIADRALSSDVPTIFEDVTLRAPLVVDERAADSPSGAATYELRNTRTADGEPLSPDDIEIEHQVSDIELIDDDGSSVTVRD